MPESKLPYIRVAVTMPRHPKLDAVPRSKRWLLIELWCYCHETRNDGLITAAAFEARGTKAERDALLAAGWAQRLPDGSVQMHDYLDYQQSAAEIEELGSKRSAAGKAGAAAKAAKRQASAEASATASDEQTGSKPQAELAVASHEATKRTSGKPDAPSRLDVEQVCAAVVNAEIAKGSKKPTVTDAWRSQARLMLDADRRSLAEVLAVIEWARDHRFWRANVRSVPKLREQFDTLRLQRETDLARFGRDRNGRPLAATSPLDVREVAVRTDW
jgi:hypothetical protein